MFPGVVPEPYSMVKLGPDMDDGVNDAYSGFLPFGEVILSWTPSFLGAAIAHYVLSSLRRYGVTL